MTRVGTSSGVLLRPESTTYSPAARVPTSQQWSSPLDVAAVSRRTGWLAASGLKIRAAAVALHTNFGD
eukprot:COSAG03_NODE_6318_length_1079_cov_1.965306_1_plen_67_part_10